MCCEKIQLELGSLKMVSIDIETRQSGIYDVIW
jgi:hypothetical protein